MLRGGGGGYLTCMCAVQMEIAATLVLRSPLVICGSVERPNLHISVARKPSEDTGMAASMLMDLILGKPCRLLPHPQPFESDYSSSGGIRPTIIYCVSRSEVDQLCSLMNANERFQGKVCSHHDASGLIALHAHSSRQPQLPICGRSLPHPTSTKSGARMFIVH